MGDNYVLSTVVTPATTRNLTTKEHVRDDLNIPSGKDDAFIDRLIVSQSRVVETYCKRIFGQQTYQDVIRPYADPRPYFLPNGRQPLPLRNTPVTSITSVTEIPSSSDTPVVFVSGTDYEADLPNGRLYRLNTVGNPRDWTAYQYVVVYVAGYTLPTQGQSGESWTLPPEIEDAVLRLIRARYAERGKDPFLKRENVPGVIEQEWWVSTRPDGNFPPDVADILDAYRAPTIA